MVTSNLGQARVYFRSQFQGTICHWGEVKAGFHAVSHTPSTVKNRQQCCLLPGGLASLFYSYTIKDSKKEKVNGATCSGLGPPTSTYLSVRSI